MGCIMFIGTPRGAFTPILSINVQMLYRVYRVFLGILSEYLALEYGSLVVNTGFGDFLASVYIVYRTPPVAHAWGVSMENFFTHVGAFRHSLEFPYRKLRKFLG